MTWLPRDDATALWSSTPNKGNKAIFNDVLPKLNDLLSNDPLKGEEAKQWDMNALAEEQTLIDPLYKGLSKSTFDDLSKLPRDKQFSTIEKARDQVVGKFGFPIFNLISYVIPIMLVMALGALSYFVLGFSTIGLIVTCVIALLIARVVVNELNVLLLYKEIKILQEQG